MLNITCFCHFAALVFLVFGLNAPIVSASPTSGSDAGKRVAAKGYSQTLLPGGSYLVTSGLAEGASVDVAQLLEAKSDTARTLLGRLHAGRAFHAATTLPDGTVFVTGGLDSNGTIVETAELFDPQSKKSIPLGDVGLLPRARHSATVLTDGTVLIVGGVNGKGEALPDVEIWNPSARTVENFRARLLHARQGHLATLLPNGSVLISGGMDANGRAVTESEVYQPAQQRFSVFAGPLPAETGMPRLEATLPANDAYSVAVDALISARFSKPLDVTTLNDATVTLFGPHGPVASKVVAAEGGLLVFVTPSAQLLPASAYTVFIKGAKDLAGNELALSTLAFRTQALPADSSESNQSVPDRPAPIEGAREHSGDSSPPFSQEHDASSASSRPKRGGDRPNPPSADLDDDEVFVPTGEHRGGRWRTGRPLPEAVKALLDRDERFRDKIARLREHTENKSPSGKATLRPLAALSQGASVKGIVLLLNDKPLANVTVSVGAISTRTNSAGEFELSGLPLGPQELVVDGSSANRGGREYGQFVFGVTVKKDKVTELPHALYMPRIRARDWIPVASPLKTDTLVTHPDLPGLEIHIPQGTVLRDRQGKILTRIAIIPVPLDRPPYPVPANFPMYFMLHPGGAVVQGITQSASKGIRIVYANSTNDAPGTVHDFWLYDIKRSGWFVYGKGKVSADGKQVVPDAGVALYEQMGAGHAIGGGPPPPSVSPPPGGCGYAGDPVDCSTGLFLDFATDLVLPGTMPISIERTYRTNDSANRGFGMGVSHSFGMYLSGGSGAAYQYPELILPDGGRVRFVKSSGSGMHDSTWTHRETPTVFFGARLSAPATGSGEVWLLDLRDGTRYEFGAYSGSPLTAIVDRLGNRTEIIRSGGNIQRIINPDGRYIDFTYDTSNRIKQLTDIIGRTVLYEYDTLGRLWKVTDPENKVTEYAYNAANRMLSIKNARGITQVVNAYDAKGRVEKQTLPDGIYTFGYTENSLGKIVQTDVTDPRGMVNRKLFNKQGYLIGQTRAFGTALQQAAAFEVQRTHAVRPVRA